MIGEGLEARLLDRASEAIVYLAIAAYYLRLAAGGAVVLVALLIFAAASLARRRLRPSIREVHP